MEAEDPFFNTQQQVHSFETRPHYDWNPSQELSQLLRLECNLFSGPGMSDNQRKQLIERYPAIQGVNYQPPATMPEAYARMSYDQKREDKMLKHHQYVTSAIFRPLDTLAHEISSEIDNPNVHRYLQIINDIRHLVLHANHDLTDSRKNIALKAINPNFRLSAANNTYYIMAQDEFHNLINNQFSTAKALQAA
ncbi:uncharacterized protein B0P05DRAFT_478656, partial [Gilbertella persicaria]|uniref:uncharacterized protein n=1 Tax=Gilbertella persicaria TaxID=101096 RepID=UPI00221F0990